MKRFLLKIHNVRIGDYVNYIVLDLEWNQSNQTAEEAGDSLLFEIIEIGAIKLSEDKTMIGEFSKLVKPQVFHEMHRITSKLIHMQMQELEKGRPFMEVASEFLDWCGEDYIFCTWGPLDLVELQKNMKFYDMEPLSKGPIRFFDVQKLFSIEYEDRKTRRSLEYAVDFLGIEKDIPFHRAFSDAYYTAKVFAHIKEEYLKNVSFDTYQAPLTKNDEVFIVFDKYAKYISREFDNKTLLMADREVSSTKCYVCGRNLRKKIRWFTSNSKNYYSMAYCDDHGYMKAKLRIRRDCNNRLYAVKTLKLVDEEVYNDLQERFTKVKEMKKKRKNN